MIILLIIVRASIASGSVLIGAYICHFVLSIFLSLFQIKNINMSSDWLETLKMNLREDEGIMYEIYKDPLGYPTFGIGHLIVASDPEANQAIGTKVSKERVEETFHADVERSVGDCRKLFQDFDELPDEAKIVIGNMMFNLGLAKLSGFQKFVGAVRRRDWNNAAEEMKNSRWYTQVTKRAERLIARIRKL